MSLNGAQPNSPLNLQTLIAAIQNSVNAQNLIATNIAANTTAVNALTTAFGVAFPPPITGSTAWTPAGIANGASAAISFAVTGAVLEDFVQGSLNEDLKGCTLTAYVPVANTVTAVIANATGSTVTFAATTLTVRVTAG